jgi:DNA-binding transcriptional ArsR family regulator
VTHPSSNLDRQLAICHTSYVSHVDLRLDVELCKALASEKRLLILEWLRDPRAHFPPQQDGDLVQDGVCSLFIAAKLGVSQPTCGEHLKILSRAGLIRGKKIKQWVFYQRDEARIAAAKELLSDDW